MVVDVGGAALGAAMGFLLTALEEVTEKNVMFKPSLKSLTATLEILEVLIDDVEKLDKKLENWGEVPTQRQEESAYYESQIKEGEKHVRKCSEVCRCNIFKKSYYTDKLLELDRTLKLLILAGFLARYSKEILILEHEILDSQKAISDSLTNVLNDISNKMGEISAKIKGERDTNSVEPGDQVISMLSSHTPHPPLNIEQEIKPVLRAPPTKPSPPPLTKPSSPPPPPFTRNYDTESHHHKFQVESAGGATVTMKPVIDKVIFTLGESAGGTTVVTMKPHIDKVIATLGVLEPLISQIEKFHTELALPNGQTVTDLKSEIEEAEKLIQKCSNASRFNLLKKKHYKDKLLAMDETLFRWVEILQMQLASDVKRSLVLVREIHAHIVEHGGIDDVVLNQILLRVPSINVSSSPTRSPRRVYEGRAS
ncbi:uncharacterized protein LOC107404757 [Ziziphus jujuba]|uniref:Uncharacterized protein LOC107404757 n=1 Tax=Ziziphus jujuba TaxID=326968 RepID=A0A6P3YU39_ZIZJJ|nr:uncharacterized protein LOC107404757 [Ziziphus jujuba]